MQNAIEHAIKLAGTQTKLAKILGISPQALSKQIRTSGKILPAHCIAVEKAFPGQITRYELDPEHFGTSASASELTIIVLQNFQSTSSTL